MYLKLSDSLVVNSSEQILPQVKTFQTHSYLVMKSFYHQRRVRIKKKPGKDNQPQNFLRSIKRQKSLYQNKKEKQMSPRLRTILSQVSRSYQKVNEVNPRQAMSKDLPSERNRSCS